jgi:quercetin dioxygenase-like cupin family protein
MERVTFEDVELTDYDSRGVTIAQVAEGEEPYRVSLATFEEHGTIGPHPTGRPQIFVVLSGEGWVSGPDGMRVRLRAGQAVSWITGEVHASGSGGGMTALIVQT